MKPNSIRRILALALAALMLLGAAVVIFDATASAKGENYTQAEYFCENL